MPAQGEEEGKVVLPLQRQQAQRQQLEEKPEQQQQQSKWQKMRLMIRCMMEVSNRWNPCKQAPLPVMTKVEDVGGATEAAAAAKRPSSCTRPLNC